MLKKYQNGGEGPLSERQLFANYLKMVEGSDDVMKNKTSLVLKPDGETYYKALEDDVYYPYKDYSGKTTIGYGRHNKTILKDYPTGISSAQANTFLLEDIKNKYDLAGRQLNNAYGKGSWDKLSERERYMVTDFAYNPGSIYKIFSKAIMEGDYTTAEKEYLRYAKNVKDGKYYPLGRNQQFYDEYLGDWIDNIKNQEAEKLEKVKNFTLPSFMKDVYTIPADNTGNIGFGFQKGGLPNMGQNSSSLYNQMQKLPGGVMMNIPGTDAIEFRGQTHKQGGIMMDEQTEVEDGETMDQVTLQGGQNRDYFFSSYLKKDGKSFADIHKDILNRGGSQEEINYLAAMQEKAANRDPNKIQSAGLGGVMKYQEGGANLSSKEIKSYQKLRYENYKSKGGDLSFRKWKKENPWDVNAPDLSEILTGDELDYITGYTPTAVEDITVLQPIQEETVGMRIDHDYAYGYKPSVGDGYSVCQSGNCYNGTGVVYSYFAENPNEDNLSGTVDGTVILKYEGEFKDGKPAGKGKITWNDIDASIDQGIPFVDWGYTEEGNFTTDNQGHPYLVSGKQDFKVATKEGIFTMDPENASLSHTLSTGYETITSSGKKTAFQDGEEYTGKTLPVASLEALSEFGIIPAKQNKITIGKMNYFLADPKLQKFITDHENFGEFFMNNADPKVLEKAGITKFSDMRRGSNVLKYQKAWNILHPDNKVKEDKGFGEQTIRTAVSSDALTAAETGDTDLSFLDPAAGLTTVDIESQPSIFTVDESKIPDLNIDPEKRKKLINIKLPQIGSGVPSEVPPLAYASAAAQMAPALYAMTHKQPTPEQVPFVSGVTSPIVPGRLRAKKLSHINMNLERSRNDADLRAFNKSIETSGGGPANTVNRMAAWSKKHQGDMQIAKAEKDYNLNIENQNVAIENQTNLHNLRNQQEAALGNAQMQAAEAQRLNEVLAINTAARNKIKDDEEYMKYASVIAGAQGIGNLFGDMLAYKGDRLRAQGYSIGGSTERMLLRQNLGRTLYAPNGTVFCENCTQEDIAKYYQTYMNPNENMVQ